MKQNETIKIGALELHFLLDTEHTNNQMVMFEFIIPAGAKVPVPHYHVEVDEALYGLEGITTSIVDGVKHEIHPGQSLFIPKGAVHYHDNFSGSPAKTLVVLTPGSINKNYFKEMSELIVPGVPPDPKKAAEIMTKYGLIPVVEKQSV